MLCAFRWNKNKRLNVSIYGVESLIKILSSYLWSLISLHFHFTQHFYTIIVRLSNL
jgi:hypothetical protein